MHGPATTSETIAMPDGVWTIAITIDPRDARLLWAIEAPDGTGLQGVAPVTDTRRQVCDKLHAFIRRQLVS